jgi:hypothetical protein
LVAFIVLTPGGAGGVVLGGGPTPLDEYLNYI